MQKKMLEEFLHIFDISDGWLEKMKEILEKRVPQGNDNFSAVAVFCKAEHRRR